MDKKALWEATKEPLRLLALAVLPFAIAYFANLDYTYAGIALVALRWLDKYLHEVGKARSTTKDESALLRGLTRF